MRFTLSPAAERDIASILVWTHESFGEQARLRYESLLVQAMLDIADDPERPGGVSRDEISSKSRTHHLWHSRIRVPESPGRVRHPRHFLIFRISSGGQIEIGRVLHDSMDLTSQLPDEYRPSD